jgi:ribosomal protein S12 methylthiotransferase accessory factor YcaO
MDFGQLECKSPDTGHAEQLEELKGLLRERGISAAYWVDHTKPELAVPVVQVFVPGMGYSYRRI